jgi:DNA polymerase-3 subunit alpha/error-prone DNA polymerase
MAKDLDLHQKTSTYARYLISRKQVPTARGTMFFGTSDHEGTYFDTTHFPDNLLQYLFKVAAIYY